MKIIKIVLLLIVFIGCNTVKKNVVKHSEVKDSVVVKDLEVQNYIKVDSTFKKKYDSLWGREVEINYYPFLFDSNIVNLDNAITYGSIKSIKIKEYGNISRLDTSHYTKVDTTKIISKDSVSVKSEVKTVEKHKESKRLPGLFIILGILAVLILVAYVVLDKWIKWPIKL